MQPSGAECSRFPIGHTPAVTYDRRGVRWPNDVVASTPVSGTVTLLVVLLMLIAETRC